MERTADNIKTEQDAHKVFVAMNDRGLSLTSTEMLKGYLLSEIKSDSIREKMNGLWKEKVLALKKDDDKGDETPKNAPKWDIAGKEKPESVANSVSSIFQPVIILPQEEVEIN